MAIDVEPKDLGKVVQLVAKPQGWSREQTRYHVDPTIYVGGNPGAYQNHTPRELATPLNEAYEITKRQRPTDFNGSKVYVRELAVRDGMLTTKAIRTDYFTLWGLPQAAPELFAQHEREVVINRATKPGEALYIPTLPWGACSHNILLDTNGDVYAMVRSRSQGFYAGRLSVTQEEQTELEDSSPFKTSVRSFTEELAIYLPQRKVRLLGVAEEKGAAYPSYAFVTETDLSPKELVRRWRKARDYNENIALILIPMTQIDKWTDQKQDKIDPQVWKPQLIAGNINQDAIIELHPTSTWRMNLAREYTKQAAS